jgi:hypothetical protein
VMRCGTVAFYLSIKQYQKYFAAEGFGGEANAVIEAAARKDTATMLKAMPDEMVTSFAIAATPEEVRERVAKMWEYVTVLQPTSDMPLFQFLCPKGSISFFTNLVTVGGITYDAFETEDPGYGWIS